MKDSEAAKRMRRAQPTTVERWRGWVVPRIKQGGCPEQATLLEAESTSVVTQGCEEKAVYGVSFFGVMKI